MTRIFRKDGKGLITSKYFKVVVGGEKIDLHRHLMEQHLGRKLETWEEVHHRNEVSRIVSGKHYKETLIESEAA